MQASLIMILAILGGAGVAYADASPFTWVIDVQETAKEPKKPAETQTILWKLEDKTPERRIAGQVDKDRACVLTLSSDTALVGPGDRFYAGQTSTTYHEAVSLRCTVHGLIVTPTEASSSLVLETKQMDLRPAKLVIEDAAVQLTISVTPMRREARQRKR